MSYFFSISYTFLLHSLTHSCTYYCPLTYSHTILLFPPPTTPKFPNSIFWFQIRLLLFSTIPFMSLVRPLCYSNQALVCVCLPLYTCACVCYLICRHLCGHLSPELLLSLVSGAAPSSSPSTDHNNALIIIVSYTCSTWIWTLSIDSSSPLIRTTLQLSFSSILNLSFYKCHNCVTLLFVFPLSVRPARRLAPLLHLRYMPVIIIINIIHHSHSIIICAEYHYE